MNNINTNWRLHYSKSQRTLDKNIEKLSTGLRINSASDDAAGLQIATRQTSQINEKKMLLKNNNDLISRLETKDGTLNITGDMLQRLKELVIQGQNGTYNKTDLESIKAEISEALSEMNRLGDKSTFNGIPLFRNALKFDQTGIVNIPHSDELSIAENLTIEMDFYLENQIDDYAKHIIKKWGSGLTNSANYVLYLFGNHGGTLPEQEGRVTLYANRNGIWNPASGSTSLETGKWYHIAVEYDHTKGGQLYLDGEPIGARQGIGLLTTNTGTLSFTPPPGYLDNVRIYNRSLTQGEIISNKEGDVTKEGLVGEWLFEELEGNIVTDSSGNANNGTMSSGTSYAKLTDYLGITGIDIEEPLSVQQIDQAIEVNSNERIQIGAELNNLEFDNDYLSQSSINDTNSRSRIMDADMANTTSTMLKEELKVQSSLKMLSKSNAVNSQILQLFNS